MGCQRSPSSKSINVSTWPLSAWGGMEDSEGLGAGRSCVSTCYHCPSSLALLLWTLPILNCMQFLEGDLLPFPDFSMSPEKVLPKTPAPPSDTLLLHLDSLYCIFSSGKPILTLLNQVRGPSLAPEEFCILIPPVPVIFIPVPCNCLFIAYLQG